MKNILSFDDNNYSSIPTQEQKKLLKKHSISNFIRPISYSENNIICNDGYACISGRK